jgi:hypothetical protein
MKKLFTLVIISTLLSSVLVGVFTPLAVGANSVTTTKITIDSTAAANKVFYIPYSSYPGYGTTPTNESTGKSWWPKRSEGCASIPTTKFKTLPWLGQNYGIASYTFMGNEFKISGDCGTRYTDGGSTNGAWLPADIYGGWATAGSNVSWTTNATSNSVESDVSAYSAKLQQAVTTDDPTNNLPDSQIWGKANMDLTDHSIPMFTRNGFADYTPSNNYYLYSSGTTLFRNTFTLTDAQITSLESVNLYAVSDDWLNIFVDGVAIASAQTNNSENLIKINLANNPTIKDVIQAVGAGEHVIAIQVNDKARWFQGPSGTGTSSNKAGLSYKMELNLSTDSTPPPTPNLSCSVNPHQGLAPLVVSATVTGGVAPYDYDWSYNGTTFVADYIDRPSPAYWSYAASGTYTVRVRDVNGTLATCLPTVLEVKAPTGTDGGEVAP